MIRAFTGPTKMTDDQVEWVEGEIIALPDEPDEVRTGCAPGLDTIAAHMQYAEYPNAWHRLFVPSAYHNEKIVHYLDQFETVEVIRCPRRSQRATAYRQRNNMMCCYEDVPATTLEAFVFSPDFYRSGEWMTINIAIYYGIEVNKHVIPENP